MAAGVLGALAVGSPALADPAGPSDYRSEVIAVEPPIATVQARIVGADSFVELSVEPGTEVFVFGYQDGDESLWFRADGAVFENRNSPSTYLNERRYGAEIPPGIDAEAEPDWRQVASDGTWAWHDHRAHWMQTARPPGASPGDRIIEEEIPMRVDGEPVDLVVISTWMPEPSIVPAVLGAVAGLASAAAAWLLARRGRPGVAAAIPVTVVALVVGAWQYRSLPASTGPRLVWIVLPAIAFACAVAGTAVASAARRRGGAWSSFASDAALLVVGVELAIWGFVRRDVLGAAVLATDAPFWLDRFATAAGVVGGVAFAAVGLWRLFTAAGGVSGSKAPTDSPRPVHP